MNSSGSFNEGSIPAETTAAPDSDTERRKLMLAGRRMGKSALMYEIMKARIEAGERVQLWTSRGVFTWNNGWSPR